jgi:hypothetical protein
MQAIRSILRNGDMGIDCNGDTLLFSSKRMAKYKATMFRAPLAAAKYNCGEASDIHCGRAGYALFGLPSCAL